MASREYLAATTSNYDSRELPYQSLQRGNYKGTIQTRTIFVNQPNPIADVTNPETGGRQSPADGTNPMMMYYAIGGLLALLLIMKKKK
jgi:hypothetical protein